MSAEEPTYRALRELADAEGTLQARACILERGIALSLDGRRTRATKDLVARLINGLDPTSNPIERRVEWLRDYVTPAVLKMREDPGTNAWPFASAIERACRTGSTSERSSLRRAANSPVLGHDLCLETCNGGNRAALPAWYVGDRCDCLKRERDH